MDMIHLDAFWFLGIMNFGEFMWNKIFIHILYFVAIVIVIVNLLVVSSST